MNPLAKKIIAIALSASILLLMYFGAYLPFRKSQLYINSLSNFGKNKARTMEEFNKIFQPVFDYRSPVGDDEIISHHLSTILAVMTQQSNRLVIDALIKEAESATAPMLKSGRGFNYTATLYTLALTYRDAAFRFSDENYYQKSIETFNKALETSPRRPGFLYGLYDLYIAKGDFNNAGEVGKIILKYWPQDEEVRKVVEKSS